MSNVERRLEALERRVALLEGVRLDNAVAFTPAAAPAAARPWERPTKRERLTGDLATFDYAVKATAGQAALFGLAGGVLGLALYGLFGLAWTVIPAAALATGAVALVLLLIDHRRTVARVTAPAGKRRAGGGELRLSVRHEGDADGMAGLEFLRLPGDVTRDALRTLAREVLDGGSLAVHSWTGRAGWTLRTFTATMAAFEKRGFVRPGRGNAPRSLTRKGQALFRALAE